MQTDHQKCSRTGRFPKWITAAFIIMTLTMTALILMKIWVPEMIDGELLFKIILTYGVLFVCAAVISVIATNMEQVTTFFRGGDKNAEQ